MSNLATVVRMTENTLHCAEKLDGTPNFTLQTSGEITRKRKAEDEPSLARTNSLSTPKRARKKVELFDANKIPRARPPRQFNAANKHDRTKQVQDAQKFFGTENWLEVYNDKARDRSLLGKGTYGSVYKVVLDRAAIPLAIKQSQAAFDEPKIPMAQESFEDDSMVLLNKLEPTIGSFVTRKVLRYSPNFCDVYGYHWGNLKFNPATKEAKLIRSSAAYVITASQLGDKTLGEEFDDLVRCNDGPAIFPLIIQCLLACATASRFGISHNDFLTKNILTKSCSATIAYRFPADLIGAQKIPIESSEVRFQTHGRLALVCDWGMSSQEEWLESHDGEQALLDCDPRVAHWELSSATLHEYYYDHTKDGVRSCVPEGMRICRAEIDTSFVHPLRFKHIRAHERDVVSLFNELLWRLTDKPVNRASRNVRSYCTAVLKELEKQRPVTSDQFIEFVAGVVSRRFLQRYTDASDFLATACAKEGFSYCIPTKKQAKKDREELREQLGLKALYNRMLPSNRVLAEKK